MTAYEDTLTLLDCTPDALVEVTDQTGRLIARSLRATLERDGFRGGRVRVWYAFAFGTEEPEIARLEQEIARLVAWKKKHGELLLRHLAAEAEIQRLKAQLRETATAMEPSM